MDDTRTDRRRLPLYHAEPDLGHGSHKYAHPCEKYPWDPREYHCIELWNGLQAMLVHEKNIGGLLSICMTINVGEMHDPVSMLVRVALAYH